MDNFSKTFGGTLGVLFAFLMSNVIVLVAIMLIVVVCCCGSLGGLALLARVPTPVP